ncbi:hypothetical protein OMP38_26905 [Cohnella ginsengisoli]|uniref:Uncharacterized protein n=1 Tax=Cohnella ginsengisoli TaxID=425004 RepID=A0A9X4KLE8_9BACL|nr:hypothetical protein [Cohnella ginsengisoli]MDG0794050.1 hypothetical protein [Cohnella ginsengisoli]
MKHYRRFWVVMLAILLVTALGGSWGPTAGAASGKPVATYASPERIQFVSYSKSWSQAKLKALYGELLRNLHGQELAYLSMVVLYPESKEGEAGYADLSYSWTEDDRSDIVMDKGTTIVLYDANRLNTVESLSATLSHEYGHHFTHYWLIKKGAQAPEQSGHEMGVAAGNQKRPGPLQRRRIRARLYAYVGRDRNYGGRLPGVIRLEYGQADDGEFAQARRRTRVLRGDREHIRVPRHVAAGGKVLLAEAERTEGPAADCF